MTDRIVSIEFDNGNKQVLALRERKFKTGSRGYMMFGKITIDGKRYQVMGNVVEIGSGPKKFILKD